jgi:hypothetical protein
MQQFSSIKEKARRENNGRGADRYFTLLSLIYEVKFHKSMMMK